MKNRKPRNRTTATRPPPRAAPADVAATWCAPATLRPWPKNPRKIPPDAVRAVAESIKRFGFGAPIVARRGGREIIAGHTRWLAAQELKLQRVPVRFLDLPEREAHLLAMADNRLAELTTWDPAPLDEVLRGYQLPDLELIGWNAKDLREIERRALGNDTAPDDEVPEPPTTPITQPGDLWQLGRHRLVCGDATNAVHCTLARGELAPFLMITDPPYGVDYDPEWRDEVTIQWAGGGGKRRRGSVQNDATVDWSGAYTLFTGAVAYVWHAGVSAAEVAANLRAASLSVRCQLIWRKQHFVFGRGAYHWQHEPCWYAVRDGKSAQWSGDRKQSTIWDIANANPMGGKQDDADTQHATQKPVECMARPMRNHGAADDVVYDPFCGSGTTLIAAEHLKRICVALEISPAYCDVIVERWQNLTGEKATRVVRAA